MSHNTSNPFGRPNLNQSHSQENALNDSLYQKPRKPRFGSKHNRIASELREKINSLIFDVQENTFHKVKAVECV